MIFDQEELAVVKELAASMRLKVASELYASAQRCELCRLRPGIFDVEGCVGMSGWAPCCGECVDARKREFEAKHGASPAPWEPRRWMQPEAERMAQWAWDILRKELESKR